jgi:hypothetical protein
MCSTVARPFYCIGIAIARPPLRAYKMVLPQMLDAFDLIGELLRKNAHHIARSRLDIDANRHPRLR